MTGVRLNSYDAVSRLLHWAIVPLLVVQYAIGWLMPEVSRDSLPGLQMNVHMSFGTVILALMAARLLWRMTHPVIPDASIPRWQQLSSEWLHWALYVLVIAATLTGWSYASMRGWTITVFSLFQLPPLVSAGSATGRFLGEMHEGLIVMLLVVAGLHVTAALVHLVIYRDQVMQRMWFGSETGGQP